MPVFPDRQAGTTCSDRLWWTKWTAPAGTTCSDRLWWTKWTAPAWFGSVARTAHGTIGSLGSRSSGSAPVGDYASSDVKNLRTRSFHVVQCIQRVTSGPTHRSPPLDSPNRVRCDAVLPFWEFKDPAVSLAFTSFLENPLRFVEFFLLVRVLIWIVSMLLPAVGFSLSRTKRLEQKGMWMNEYLVWKI